MKRFFLIIIIFFSFLQFTYALEPYEVMVLANKNSAQSKGLAKYYMKKRNIPEKNLLLVWISDKETCSRDDYKRKIIPPVRKFLAKTGNKDIRCIVTFYGLPLKIKSNGFTEEEKKNIAQMEKDIKNVKSQIDSAGEKSIKSLKKKLRKLSYKLKNYKIWRDRTASFDSELSLVKKKEYALKMWQPNPYCLAFGENDMKIKKSDVLMVSRLDGSSPEIVKRIINDTLFAEKNGLKGKAYFDARWKKSSKKNVSGYALYDRSIHRAYDTVKSEIPAVLDDSQALFKENACPDTAIYCGWYSLARYIDSFTWAKGSVGYHIASQECGSLKRKSGEWCKNILDKGGSVTIGPVGEPYVQSFPLPEIFFKYFIEGRLTLSESYLVSVPFLSWKMVLIGDPLYRVNLKK